MELAVAELLAAQDRAGAWVDHQGAVLDVPVCGPSSIASPVGLVLAVEKNDGIGRSLAGRLLGAAGSGGDDRRQGPVTVVNVPAIARQHRRILETDLGPGLVLPEGHCTGTRPP